MIWKEDRLDQITRYDRDGLGRTWRERWKNSAGTTIRTMIYGFDDFGRLTGVTDPSANYTYVYDALSRVTQITHDPDGLTPNVVVDQAYDAAGNRTQMKATVASMNDFVNDYTFDALNRITVITQGEQTIGNPVAAKRANLAYDASDRLTYVWRYSSLDTSEYVGRVKYISYDKAGRLTDMKYDGGGIATIDYDIRYADHLLDYVTITSSAVTINYNYDSVDQVNNIDYTGTGMPADVTYGYDDSGNRTNTGYSTGTFNRLTSDGTYNYTYDANGNRTLRTKISDNTKTEYTWDHRNRLTGVKFKTSAGTLTKEIQYFYDVYNRLVRRRIDADGAGAGGFTDTFWAYDGDNPILEFASGTATAPSHRYLWGPAVDQILADEQVATGSPNDVRWPMTDWQGTVRDVATYNASTNVTTIANHKVYEAFGKVYSESGPTVDTIFGYTGRYFDDDTGLQWNLNRWYDPLVGRWLSEDPIGFSAGDPNLYRYVANSPGAYVDPSGLRVYPRDDVGGSYEDFLARKPGSRFIYTTNCGWLDRSHFGMWKNYHETYKHVLDILQAKTFVTPYVRLLYKGTPGQVTVRYDICGDGVSENLEQLAKDITLALYVSLWKFGEGYQTAGLGGAVGMVYPRADTDYSLEDIPTNWVGLYLGTELAPGEVPDAALMERVCGQCLSRDDALRVWDKMGSERHALKNGSIVPILFDLSKWGINDCSRSAEPAESLDSVIARLGDVYRKHVTPTDAKYRIRIPISAWTPISVSKVPSPDEAILPPPNPDPGPKPSSTGQLGNAIRQGLDWRNWYRQSMR